MAFVFLLSEDKKNATVVYHSENMPGVFPFIQSIIFIANFVG